VWQGVWIISLNGVSSPGVLRLGRICNKDGEDGGFEGLGGGFEGLGDDDRCVGGGVCLSSRLLQVA